MGTEISIKGASVNPTSGKYPINRNGAFVNSGLSDAYDSFGPFPPTGLKFYDSFANSTLLNLSPIDIGYTFGQAFFDQFGVVASTGLAVHGAMGEAVMGCGISAGTNGVFRASGAQAFITIGNTPFTSIGVNMFSQSVRIGSHLINGAPSNTSTPAAWTKVQDQNGVTYYLPLYQ